MKPLPRFIAVIHVTDNDQATQQASVALDNGADGIFLIDHRRSYKHLSITYSKVRVAFPRNWIGLNFLDLSPYSALAMLPQTADGLWLDSVEGLSVQQIPQQRSFRIFAGAAFKYQAQPTYDQLPTYTKAIADVYDVVTTSGPGTGQAADLQKIACMKGAIGDRPLAIASGITVDNVDDFLPYIDCFLVATGISKSFTELDPNKVRELSDKIKAKSPPVKHYWVHKENAHGMCPVCGHILQSCHVGDYCGNSQCTYADGSARLTVDHVRKLRESGVTVQPY